MPGGVIEVRRSERLGLFERLWLPGLMLSFWVAARRFFRGTAGGEGRARASAPLLPHERPANVRGMPVLIVDAGGPRCVGCELCATICPAQCVRMEVESGSPPHDAALDRDESPGPKVSGTRIERFEIDMSRCFHCGLCEEVCPADALVMSPLFEIASSDAENLIFDLDSLLVPAHLLPRQLELRGAGAVSGFPAEKGAG
jgi:NADH-quinone oxidoreductase subunit I